MCLWYSLPPDRAYIFVCQQFTKYTHQLLCWRSFFVFSVFIRSQFCNFCYQLITNRQQARHQHRFKSIGVCVVLCVFAWDPTVTSELCLCVCSTKEVHFSIFLHTITLWTLCSFLSWELCDPWAPDSHNQYHRRRRLCLITCCRTLSNQKQKKKKTLRPPPPPPPPPRQSHTSLCDCSKRRQTVDLSSVCVCVSPRVSGRPLNCPQCECSPPQSH